MEPFKGQSQFDHTWQGTGFFSLVPWVRVAASRAQAFGRRRGRMKIARQPQRCLCCLVHLFPCVYDTCRYICIDTTNSSSYVSRLSSSSSFTSVCKLVDEVCSVLTGERRRFLITPTALHGSLVISRKDGNPWPPGRYLVEVERESGSLTLYLSLAMYST